MTSNSNNKRYFLFISILLIFFALHSCSKSKDIEAETIISNIKLYNGFLYSDQSKYAEFLIDTNSYTIDNGVKSYSAGYPSACWLHNLTFKVNLKNDSTARMMIKNVNATCDIAINKLYFKDSTSFSDFSFTFSRGQDSVYKTPVLKLPFLDFPAIAETSLGYDSGKVVTFNYTVEKARISEDTMNITLSTYLNRRFYLDLKIVRHEK